MLTLIFAFAYLTIAFCLAILIAPQLLRKLFNFFSLGSRLYLAGLLRIIVGVSLLTAATQAKLWGYVVTLGLLLTASGISLFFFALRRTKKLLRRLQNQPNLIIRLYAICGLIIWALLIYALPGPCLLRLLH